jgi:hypothetical protein
MTQQTQTLNIERGQIAAKLKKIRQGWEEALDGDWQSRPDIALLLSDFAEAIDLTEEERITVLGATIADVEAL